MSRGHQTTIADDPLDPRQNYARLVIQTPDNKSATKDILRHTTLIGSVKGCNIQLVAKSVAPVQCVITVGKSGVTLRALRAPTQTTVNGVPADVEALANGDRIQIGPFEILVETNLAPSPIGVERELTTDHESAHEPSLATLEFAATQAQLQEEQDLLEADRSRQEEDLQRQRDDLEKELAAKKAALEAELDQQKREYADWIESTKADFEQRQKQLDDQQLEVEEALAQLKHHQQKTENEQQQLRDSQNALETDRLALQQDRDELLQEKRELETGTNRLEQQSTELQQKFAQLETDHAQLLEEQERLQNRAQEIHDQTHQLDEAAKEVEQRVAEQDRRQQQLDQQASKLEQLSTGLDERDAELRKLDSTLESMRLQTEQERESLATLQEEVQRSSQHVMAERQHLEQLQEQFEEQSREFKQKQSELDDRQAELSIAETTAEQNRHNLEQLLRDAEESAGRNQALAEQLASREADLSTQRTQISDERNKIAEDSEKLSAERTRLTEVNQQLASRTNELDSEQARIEAEKEQLNDENERLQLAKESMDVDSRKLREELLQLEADREELVKTQQEVVNRQEEIAAHQVEVNRRQEQLHSAESALQLARDQHKAETEKTANRELQLRNDLIDLERKRLQFLEEQEQASDLSIIRKLLNRGYVSRFQADWFLNGHFRNATVNGYRLEELLDAGGMGWVYLAEHVDAGHQVALKVLARHMAQNPDLATRFELEGRAGLRLNHPNIVRTYEVDRADTFPFIAMEFVIGINLTELVDVQSAVPWPQACSFLAQAAAAIDHVHKMHMVHRDVKPGNLLVDRHGGIKLLDFGLALTRQDEDEFTLARVFGHECVGTADFIAPEQAIDSFTVDERADIYSLGCVLYFAITGEPPHPVEGNLQKLQAHLNQQPRPLSDVVPGVPEELDALVTRMLAKSPDQRPQSAREVIESLAPLAERRTGVFSGFEFHTVLAKRAETARQRLRNAAKPAENDKQGS